MTATDVGQVTETNTVTDLAQGTRQLLGTVTIDTATAVIRSVDPGADPPTAWPRSAISTRSGFGDGTYEVFTVSRHDTVVGLEVVFICHRAEAVADTAVAATGHPHHQHHPGPAARFEEIDCWLEAETTRTRVWKQAYRHQLTDVGPDDDTVPVVVSAVDHDGTIVEITDPYRGHTGPVVALTAGRYVVVRWMSDEADWGFRCARLGVYRSDNSSTSTASRVDH